MFLKIRKAKENALTQIAKTEWGIRKGSKSKRDKTSAS